MPDPTAPPAQTRTVYLPNYGVNVNVPANATDSDIDAIVQRNRDTLRAHSPAVQKANSALATAAKGVGLPTTQRGAQTVLPNATIQQGIPNAVQSQQQAQHDADMVRETSLVRQQTGLGQSGRLAPVPDNPFGPSLHPNDVAARQQTQQARQQYTDNNAAIAPLEQLYNPGSLLNTINNATNGVNTGPLPRHDFDEVLPQQTGAYGGLEKLSAGLLNSIPLIGGLAALGPEAGAIAAPVFAGQMGLGTLETARDTDLLKSDPAQYATLLAGNALLTLLGAHGTAKAAKGLLPRTEATPAPAVSPASPAAIPDLLRGNPDAPTSTFSNGPTAAPYLSSDFGLTRSVGDPTAMTSNLPYGLMGTDASASVSPLADVNVPHPNGPTLRTETPADVPAPTSRRPNRIGQPAPADVASAGNLSNGETLPAAQIPPADLSAPQTMANMFSTGDGGIKGTYIDAAWKRVEQGKSQLFAERPGSLEAKIQNAVDSGQVQSKADIAAIVDAHYNAGVKPNAPAMASDLTSASGVDAKQGNVHPALETPIETPVASLPEHLTLTPKEVSTLPGHVVDAYHDIVAAADDHNFTRAEGLAAAHQLSELRGETNVRSAQPQEPSSAPGTVPDAAQIGKGQQATDALGSVPRTETAGSNPAETFTPRPAQGAGDAPGGYSPADRAAAGTTGARLETEPSLASDTVPGGSREQAGNGDGSGRAPLADTERQSTLNTPPDVSPLEKSNAEPSRAASINLDRLNTSEEVKNAIREAVNARAGDIEAARGGRISHAETVETARSMGLTPEQVQAITPGSRAAHAVALRELLTDSAERLQQAREAYQAQPSDATQGAFQLAAAEHNTLLSHAVGHASESGRALNSYKILADAFRSDKPNAAPTPADVEHLFKPETTSRPADPTAPTYGSRNKLVSQADAAAARARLQRNLGKLNAGLDPALLGDVAKLALFHFEAGARQFGTWAQTMRQEVPGLSEGDLQTTWANLKAEAQKTQQTRVQSSVFVDQLGQRLGRSGAANFVEALRDEHGSTELLDKLVTEQTLTPEEGQKVASAYLDNQRTPAGRRETTGAMRTVSELVNEARKEAHSAAMRAKRTNAPALTPEQAFDQRLARTYGRKGADTFRAQIGGDIIAKMLGGKELTAEERQAVADAHMAAQRPKAQPAQLDAASAALKEIVTEARKQAKTGQQQAQTPADVARKILLSDSKADADRVAAKLAAVDPHDVQAINKIMREETRLSLWQQAVNVRKAGLLSSPRTIAKIVASHGVAMTADELSSYPSAIVDAIASHFTGKRTITAARPGDLLQAAREGATKGVQEGMQIARYGEEGAKENGVEPIGGETSDVFNARIQTNHPALDAVLNKIYDSHGAAYRPFRVAALTRSLQNQARVIALNEGLKGPAAETRAQQLLADPTPEMLINAGVAVQESLLFNRNRTSNMVKAVKREGGPGVAATADYLLPFPRISSNIVGRLLEHVFGVPLSVVHAASMRRQGMPFDAAAQERFSKTFGRGALGLGTVALGYKMAHAGMLTGFGDDKSHDGGRLHIGGRSYAISNEGPLPAALTFGATMHELTHTKHPAYRNAALETVAENPVIGVGEQFFNPHDPTGKAFVGGNLGSFVPTIFSDVAAQMDNHARKHPNPLSYVQGRVPGLRNRLPEADYTPADFPLIDPSGSHAETRTIRMRSRGRH